VKVGKVAATDSPRKRPRLIFQFAFSARRNRSEKGEELGPWVLVAGIALLITNSRTRHCHTLWQIQKKYKKNAKTCSTKRVLLIGKVKCNVPQNNGTRYVRNRRYTG